MKNPLVAVITTCYNQADIITDAMRSVAEQQTDAELIHVICDDGSTDNSLEVLRDWEARYPHIKVLSVTNRGMAGALNACMMVLPDRVENVVLLAGDDYLADNFVAECLDEMTPDVDAVVTALRRVDYPGFPHHHREMPPERNPTLDEIWAWRQTWAWGIAMYRRSVLVEMGGWHPWMGGDCDWDLWVDFVARGYRFAYAPDTCFFYRFVASSMNRKKTAAEWDEARREMMRHHRRDTMPGQEFS